MGCPRVLRAGVAIAILAVLAGGCGSKHRSAAQRTYLVSASSSLGACAFYNGGDFGAPFDPFDPDSWDGSGSPVSTWARVDAWRVVSKPKHPPDDRTVRVAADLTRLRGDAALLPARLGAHESLARDAQQAVGDHLRVFVGVSRVAGAPYAEEGIALDADGRIGFLGECASRQSDQLARTLGQSFTPEAVIAPAVEQWLSTGDADTLVATLKRASPSRS